MSKLEYRNKGTASVRYGDPFCGGGDLVARGDLKDVTSYYNRVTVCWTWRRTTIDFVEYRFGSAGQRLILYLNWVSQLVANWSIVAVEVVVTRLLCK